MSDKTRDHALAILRNAKELTGNPDRRENIIKRAGKILAENPAPSVRLPYLPHSAQWLYSLFDENEAGYKSRDGGRSAATTLHLGSYPRDIAERMVRRSAALGYKQIVVCARSGLDASKSFAVDGNHDWLENPEGAAWLFALCDELNLGIYMFLLDDDDVGYNSDWPMVKKGWARFMDRWGQHRCLVAVLTGIEVDETWGEQDVRPQSAKVKTLTGTTERVTFLHDNYPDVPVGVHFTSDTMLWECGQDFAYMQSDAENHTDGQPDGTLRSRGAFRDEYGPGRRGGEAIAAGIPLLFGESANALITPKWMAENQALGAHEGLAASQQIVPATGMGH